MYTLILISKYTYVSLMDVCCTLDLDYRLRLWDWDPTSELLFVYAVADVRIS